MLRSSVLLVDDNDDFLTMWKLLLRHDSRISSIRTAQSGEDAVRQLVLDGPPSVVFADIWMDGLSGYDLVDFVKRTYPDTPIVLTSAAEGTRDEALRRGATAFVPKAQATSEQLSDLLWEYVSADAPHSQHLLLR